MANLPETDTFDAGVYQLETTDPCIGGADGKDNAGARNLANRTNYLKKHLDGMLSKSVAGAADVTLTVSEANNAILELTGVLTGNIAVIVPASPTRSWIVKNVTSGNFIITIKTPAGNGVVVAQGAANDIYTDGTHVYLTSVADGQAGEVAFFAKNTAPTGWLKANGAAVSRTAYAALFAAIGVTFGAGDGSTTFNLPDLRGEFPRGWDDGRGVDSGRSFGSIQTDQMQDHWHKAWTQNSNWAASGTGVGVGALFSDVPNGSTPGFTVASGSYGPETRPRNVALLACIKY